MSIKRTSSAAWAGDGLSGEGSLNTQSGVFKAQPFSFKTRFSDETGKSGTNPEELIAAAHAGCFTMALAFQLKEAGFVADRLSTEATVTLDQVGGGFRFKVIELSLTGKVPNISVKKFEELAQNAKANCPVSLALASVPIQLKISLQ